MLKTLLNRPISVLTSFVVLLILSYLSFVQLPVSLLPEADVPQIIIKVQMPQASPLEIEQNSLRLLREQLVRLNSLKDLRSEAHAGQGFIKLFFEHGASMNLRYIEVTEKIDQIIPLLPKKMAHPQVIRLQTADVPIIRLQITPKQINMLEASEIVERTIKKRLEGLAGLSIIDASGLHHKMVSLHFYPEKLAALRITEREVIDFIQANNQELGSIQLRDGNYRYFIQVGAKLQSVEDLQKLYFTTATGNVISLNTLAAIKIEPQPLQGMHLYNQKPALVLTLHKQSQAQMHQLLPQIEELVHIFEQDYPFLGFSLTQNQFDLLDVGIQNLQNDLLFGGIFAFLILFIFIGNYQIPIITGLILPTSLVLAFLLFSILQTSINIVSLSGLALGLGMTIDNAIIIFDNIAKKRLLGRNVVQASLEGTAEMVAPLSGASITTFGVFIPLIALSGLVGAFTRDQAIAVGAILATSLLVSCVLLPLLYRLFYQKSQQMPKEDTQAYLVLLKGYEKIYQWLLRRSHLSFMLIFIAGLAGLGLFFVLPLEGLPHIRKADLQLKLTWNEPITLQEAEKRIQLLFEELQPHYLQAEADIGIQQFILQKEIQNSYQATLYLLFKNYKQKEQQKRWIAQYCQKFYPKATYLLADAPNAFDLMFKDDKPYYAFKLKNSSVQQPIAYEQLEPLLTQLPPTLQTGQGIQRETQVKIDLKLQPIYAYHISPQMVVEKIQYLFGNKEVSLMQTFGQTTPIRLAEQKENFMEKIQQSFITIDSLRRYPLSQLLDYHFVEQYKCITADKIGIYHALNFEALPTQDMQDKVENFIQKNNYTLEVEGKYFDNYTQLKELIIILLIAISLLYFILIIEFESLTQPLVVLMTLPIGFSGSLLFTYWAGSTLNLMTMIGLVVMLGIIDNEAILKIATINRLKKEMPLQEAIHQAGLICFKPVLMTSLTNILALFPFLFDESIGGDLQKPFVLAIMGGLSIGTFTALFFVPLAYQFWVKK